MKSKRQRRSSSAQRPSGFSLIELMVAVAIISVLASIALPRYLNYVYRARQTEALTILGGSKQQQFAYFAVNDCFANTERMPPGPPGVSPQPFTSVPGGGGTPCDGAMKPFVDVGITPANQVLYFVYECSARISSLMGGMGTDEFTCSALGDLDGDAVFSEYIYCTDLVATGMGLPSPQTGAACDIPYDAYRVSIGAF